MCSGVGCGKMDHPTRRAINHCQREGEKWGERDGRAAERKEKKKKASEDRRETGSDGVRDERLGEELKRWTVGETNSGEKSCGIVTSWKQRPREGRCQPVERMDISTAGLALSRTYFHM